MLRLIIAAVLASACLAYPQRRDGVPEDASNLQGFDQGMQAMPNMQGMQGMPMPGMAGGQFLPFNPNMAMPYKRDEDLEKRRHRYKFNGDSDASPFQSEDGFENFMDFMKDNSNENLPLQQRGRRRQ
uniref:G066 VD Superfamily B precursor conopeptide n=1 Tax=Conus geographus TaxID=6491 RepID=X5IWQ9_CONGE|nr:G066_VD_Superfamily_B_precursor_conopeptide [Conus geographus]